MFRSGTTLLARMLNVHPEVVCASDPMRPLVNSFRYDLADEAYQSSHHRFDPLDDYFIHNTELQTRVLESDLNRKIGCPTPELLTAVQNRAKAFSGIYSNFIDLHKDVRTYSEVAAYLLETIEQAYCDGRTHRLIAFKEVWSNEFYPALRRSFPKTKCLIIVRDPRSILASKVGSGEPYPCAFMGRQWRKLACLSAYLKHAYPEDVFLLNYEQLVRSPEKFIQEVCDFLEIEFVSNFLDLTLYKDGWNKEWKPNSSFAISNSKSINSNTVEKWKSILSPEEIATIELYTHDWMLQFNYEPLNSRERLLDLGLENYRRYKNSELADWIRAFSFDEDRRTLESEIAVEKLRLLNLEKIPHSMRMGLHLPWWQA